MAAEGPAPKRARIDATHIDLLAGDMFASGSRHSAPTPALKRFEVRDGKVDVEWEATGSSVYAVSARGRVRVWFDERCRLRADGLAVCCTCPDARRHTGKYLCKHAIAAVRSVVDTNTEEKFAELRRAAEAARIAQDGSLPGERERVVNALAHLPAADVVELVRRAALGSVEGLRAVSTHVFPADTVAAPNVLRCLRCNEDYDPSFCGRNACRVLHPEDMTTTEWENSKDRYDFCSRCNATFNVVGRPRGVSDDGEYCFVGDHTTDPALVKEEDWEGTSTDS